MRTKGTTLRTPSQPKTKDPADRIIAVTKTDGRKARRFGLSIGVLLGGCGHYDGTDVHEAVFALLALEAAGEVQPGCQRADRREGDECQRELERDAAPEQVDDAAGHQAAVSRR